MRIGKDFIILRSQTMLVKRNINQKKRNSLVLIICLEEVLSANLQQDLIFIVLRIILNLCQEEVVLLKNHGILLMQS
jgi:hypothetical protein